MYSRRNEMKNLYSIKGSVISGICGILLTLSLFISAAHAVSLLNLMGAGAGSSGSAGTPECSIAGVTCEYGYSLSHQVVPGATKAIAVYNVSTATATDIGFDPDLTTSVSAIAAACGINTIDCRLETVYDQKGTGCDPTQATPADMPAIYLLPTHGGKPVLYLPYNQSTTIFLQSTAAGCSGTITGDATRTTIAYSDESLASHCCGEFGFGENTPGVVDFAMWAYGPYYSASQFYPFMDIEGFGINGSAFGFSFSDLVFAAEYTTGGLCTATLYINGSSIGNQACGQNHALATQNRMNFGTSGDHTAYGPGMLDTMLFLTNTPGATAEAAVSASLTGRSAALAAATGPGPGDVFTSGEEPQQTSYLVSGAGLRPLQLSYLGPLLNVCQGTSATCEDIGQTNAGTVAAAFDIATASAYCGPVSGLNNCRVSNAYQQALDPALGTGNTHNVGNFTDQGTAANRPGLAFGATCLSITKNQVCMTFSGTQKLCQTANGSNLQVGSGSGSNNWTAAAVGARTLTNTTIQPFWGAYTSGQTLYAQFGLWSNPGVVGYAAINTSGTDMRTTASTDNAMHSLILSAISGAPVLYTDGVASTGGNQTIRTYRANQGCLGENPSFTTQILTGQLLEFELYGSPTLSAGLGMSSGQAATLLANQKAYWGF
jgi:hypothetical protein